MRVDYLIVGAGASGCALASHLSADPTLTVLLVDGGAAKASLVTAVPRAFPFALRAPRLSSYPTAAGRRHNPGYWVRGRGIGGSTLVNGMMYLRGDPSAYDQLESGGNTGWGWPAFEGAFSDIESLLNPSIGDLDPLAATILGSVAAYGARVVSDLNTTAGNRVGPTPATIRNGVRQHAARALLHPARRRSNLHVLADTQVGRLTWQGNRVTGVLARRGGTTRQITAENVVLSGGTIETPLLLERSGIGRADHLAEAGIELRVESPRVGTGVREHRGHGLQLRLHPHAVAHGAQGGAARYWANQTARYAVTRSGAIARPAYDVTGLISLGDPEVGELQVMGLPFGLHPSGALRPAPYPAALLCAYPTKPTSEWSIHVDARDPDSNAVITPPSELTDDDQRAAHAAIHALNMIAEGGPLAALSAGPDADAPAGIGQSIYHAVGSAAMGPDRDAVTDADLRVRGTEGLHIADLSLLPSHPSGSTAAPAMAIGWLAAERIRAT